MAAHGRIVYVSGNNASGKSTLARELANRLHFRHLPEVRFDTSYLDDLFLKQRRWSFEAQVYFLSFKVQLVDNAAENDESVFVDRSPYEDAEVFARLFYETGRMDRRSYKTYQQLYEIMQASLPIPGLFMFCRCSAEEVLRRVSGRGRDYEKFYPKDHLRLLGRLYDEWLTATVDRFPGRVFEIDAEGIDFRSDYSTLDAIASEVSWQLNNRSNQMLLPLEGPAVEPLLVPPETHFLRNARQPRKNARRLRRKPMVYIAAPFTGRAAPEKLPAAEEIGEGSMADHNQFLWKISSLHGVLDAPHREFLEWIEELIRSCGCDTLIPQRDINGWGKKELTPEQVAEACTAHVFSSDLIVALPASSFGTHYEVGVAMGYGLPAILMIPNNESTSVLGQKFCNIRTDC
jgi:deoxyadenosine/deoxycytidine kinase